MKNLKLSDFDYALPKNLIAKYPSQKRDEARLLVVDRKTDRILDKKFFDIIDFLKEGDLLILNETKVLPARLFGCKKGMEKEIEILLVRPLNKGWLALSRPGKRLRDGDVVRFSKDFKAEILKTNPDGSKEINLICENNLPVIENVNRYGNMPIPPYLERRAEEKDKEVYQTVFAKTEGSVASPTAGLHWTDELLEKVKAKGADVEKITLDIGLGTFLPVKEEVIEKHKMHSERFEISEKASEKINRAKSEGRRVIACGTTVLRALESSAADCKVQAGAKETDIFIYPPYNFKIADALITNFHLPKSTLLMLISAFYNREKILELYKYAVENEYRFFSYGDAMFLC